MKPARIVIDTNVFVSALRSRQGASHKLLMMVGATDAFQVCVSVPLVLEYEDATKRQSRTLGLTHGDIEEIIDYICSVAEHREIFFLWRPFLKDPKDDLVLELAVEAECESIITYNARDFAGIETFGLRTLTPKELLQQIGAIR